MKSIVAAFALVLGLAAAAQQQTAPSGGIPVPAAPSAMVPETQQSTESAAIFRIRVLDGRNGAPMQGAHLSVWYDEAAGSGTMVTTDMRGIAAMPRPLGDPVRILVSFEDLIDCRRNAVYDAPTGFNLQAVALKGQRSENTCGKISEHTKPGELVMFARQPRWYEGLNRSTEK